MAPSSTTATRPTRASHRATTTGRCSLPRCDLLDVGVWSFGLTPTEARGSLTARDALASEVGVRPPARPRPCGPAACRYGRTKQSRDMSSFPTDDSSLATDWEARRRPVCDLLDVGVWPSA